LLTLQGNGESSETNMIIKRDYYLQQLISSKSNNLIKIVTGIRRSGKSFLLFNLFHNHLIETGIREDHIIEIALDNRLNKNALHQKESMIPLRR